jgi:hypothetical protein
MESTTAHSDSIHRGKNRPVGEESVLLTKSGDYTQNPVVGLDGSITPATLKASVRRFPFTGHVTANVLLCGQQLLIVSTSDFEYRSAATDATTQVATVRRRAI